MKIQSLAVIFTIIILPITIVLNSYIRNYVTTLNYQISYDSKLDNATYDALKAFQLNTFNNSSSNYVNSKMRDIEAAANSFFESISQNFNMIGYNNETLKDYIPALVFTMYDGYYIYSLYNNKLDDLTQSQIDANPQASIKGNGEQTYGFKPYIYYSCRYIKDDLDVVITYALDNYIEIHGMKGTAVVNISGYLINDISKNASGDISYRGITISQEGENVLNEWIGEKESDRSNANI